MSDELFSGDKLIDLTIYYVSEKNASGHQHLTILDENKANALKADTAQKERVKTLRTQWRPQSWQAANELLVRSTVYNFQQQKNEIDWNKFRDAKLKSLLVDWDAKTANGEKLPCVEGNINKLNASVAMALIEMYDKATSVDSEELGK